MKTRSPLLYVAVRSGGSAPGPRRNRRPAGKARSLARGMVVPAVIAASLGPVFAASPAQASVRVPAASGRAGACQAPKRHGGHAADRVQPMVAAPGQSPLARVRAASSCPASARLPRIPWMW